MFSKLTSLNSRRNIKNNVLYFSSMIITVVAFYIILSLSSQDVFIYLKEMESDAVSKLLKIVPVFFVFSLIILSVLVYFSTSIQLEERRKEIGIYLTLGMKSRRLHTMLLVEEMKTSFLVILIGLPIAIAISEIISLITSKLLGLGIIGHSFNFSLSAILFTIFGFLIVRICSLLILSRKTNVKEIGELLYNSDKYSHKNLPKYIYLGSLIIGVLLLIKGYSMGISGESWNNIFNMGKTLLIGFLGMVLLFYGLRILIEGSLKLNRNKKLHIYNVRQIYESVVKKSFLLAICSMLILSSIALFATGMTSSINIFKSDNHILDYTFAEDTSLKKVEDTLKTYGLRRNFAEIVNVKLGRNKSDFPVDLTSLRDLLMKEKKSPFRDTLINSFNYDSFYLIALSDYNEIRKLGGLSPMNLRSDQASIYIDNELLYDSSLLKSILEDEPHINMGDKEVKLNKDFESLPFVTDREITILTAFIVPDDIFDLYVKDNYSTYISATLKDSIIAEKGLAKAIFETNESLNKTGLNYESYIQNIGRQLFYIVSISYITIYLAVIFLVISNTIIGVLFLMGQRKFKNRYLTLIYLGANFEDLSNSSNKQINYFFGIPVFIAILNSYFLVKAILPGIISSSMNLNFKNQVTIILSTIILLGFFEIVYINLVKKNSNRFLKEIIIPNRED